ncbi:MAG: hypothetical protein KAJ19_23890 [Gammaproteobacteria bacterium]|nr:hypothetical protein [Gammaproteobacteria bacterium]
MNRTGPPKRKTPIRKRNTKRAKRAFARNFGSKAYVEAVHSVPCVVRGSPNPTPCKGPPTCMHRRARRAGDGWFDIVPACEGHHDESHRGIQTFARKYELDLEAAAAQMVEAFGYLILDEIPF